MGVNIGKVKPTAMYETQQILSSPYVAVIQGPVQSATDFTFSAYNASKPTFVFQKKKKNVQNPQCFG